MGAEPSKPKVDTERYGMKLRKGGTALLIIDPQVDFHEGGSLAVAGARADSERIAELIRIHGDEITQINVTLDSHQRMHIGNSLFWVNKQKEHPPPFTLISVEDVKQNTWFAARPELGEHAARYIEQLEKMGRKHCIWPDHCIIGTPGHCVEPKLAEALAEWAQSKLDVINYVFKGSNCLTEMFSALKADIVIPGDPSTGLNRELVERLRQADRVLVCGQALSHCVNFSVRDLVDALDDKDDREKIFLLEDCASPVGGFEGQAKEFIEFCTKSGIRPINSTEAFS